MNARRYLVLGVCYVFVVLGWMWAFACTPFLLGMKHGNAFILKSIRKEL